MFDGLTLLGILVLLALAAFLIKAARQPDVFRVARTASINAAPQAVFPHVNNLRNWAAWSPWAGLDPDARIEFEGAEAGIGALMRWDGGKKIGAGSMEIIESRPAEFIKFQLIFTRPMQSTQYASFTFAPEGAGTKVTWEMSGHNSFAGKVIGLVMNCEKMVARQYDQGLSNLKTVAERPDGAATSA